MKNLSRMLPIVVVGCGAAGLLAAIFAADDGQLTMLLERTRDGGRKILISGGGRCNVLPSEMNPSDYITASSPNTMKKILRSWPLPEQRAYFEQRLGLRLVLEPETGKLFPASNRARDVRDGLVELAQHTGVQLRFGECLTDLDPSPAGDHWLIGLESGETLQAAAVILATGGLSVPATGSDGTGLRIVERLGHTIHPLYPALTPLTAEPPLHAHLAGVSLTARLMAPLARGRFSTEGGFLFTHRGYSGPSVLNISHLAVRSAQQAGPRQSIRVQWTAWDGPVWEEELVRAHSGSVASMVRRHLPDRLVETLLAEAGIDRERSLAHLRREERIRLVETLSYYELPWTGDEGYKKAEVTGGGVSLAEIDPRTMESRIHPRLFLCGEMLDAFGPIGGYNFYWAWATGRAAGLGAADAVRTRE
jgi:predicted Rossmann fold flavoprotein